MALVARPWLEKAFRFDLALEDIQVAANEPQGAGSRSPRWVVSGTVADRGGPAFPWGFLPWVEVRVWSEGARERENAGSVVSVRLPLDGAQGGKARFSATLDAKPLKVALDPNLLDYNPTNDSARVSTERPVSGLPVLGAALLLLLAWSLVGRRSRRVLSSPISGSEMQS